MRCAPAWVLARKDHVDPVYLGRLLLPGCALNVPAVVVIHILMFAYLLNRAATNERPPMPALR